MYYTEIDQDMSNGTLTRKILLTLLTLICVFFAVPNISFASEPVEPWSTTTSLPYPLASLVNFSYSNKLFVIGGSAETGHSKYGPISSTINSAGSISNWNNESNQMPKPLIFHATAAKNNFVYILGGLDENSGNTNNFQKSVYMSSINNQGNTPWQTQPQLPNNSGFAASTVVGDRIYFAGGTDRNSTFNQIYSATINSDGTLGNWTQAGTLPQALSGFGMITNGNHLVVIGGRNGNNQDQSGTYTAPINSDGSIGTWATTSILPQPISRGSIVKVGSKVVSLGGSNNGITLEQVYYADLNSDGTVGDWQMSENYLPQPLCCGAATATDDYIYLTGGYSETQGYLDTVYYSKINNSSDNILDVPFFSQNALPWGPSEYDHTKSLGVIGYNTTMDRWGCAVTSVAMVLNYHNIKEFMDGTPIDPGSLNQWLKDTKNKGYLYGYGKDGSWYSSFNWPVIGKLTKDLHAAEKSSVKLQHNRQYPSTTTTELIKHDLTVGNSVSKFPDILYVNNSSHFVVAKGVSNNTFAINDPEWNYPTLDSFNNTYSQVDRYIPSNTDLSYLLMVVNPDVEILVTDSQGRKTGKIIKNGQVQTYNEIQNATYGYEAPIGNPDGQGNMEKLGTGVNSFLFPEATDGNYDIELSSKSNTQYTVNFATFAEDGDNNLNKFQGLLQANTNDTFSLSFDKTSQENSKTQKTITFQSTIQDIINARDLQMINKGLATALIADVKNAEKQALKHKEVAEKMLEVGIKLLDKSHNHDKLISDEAYEILHYDFKTLISSIK